MGCSRGASDGTEFGTNSANTQEKAATTEDLTTINYVSRTYRQLNREMCCQRDWFASEHDAKKLQEAEFEPLKWDWRQTFSIGKVTDSANKYNSGGIHPAITLEIRNLKRCMHEMKRAKSNAANNRET